jgi:integrase/recombinase XerD
MTINTYPVLTHADTDVQLIRLWISQKSPTTQQTYLMVARQFLAFAGKDLRSVMLEEIVLWLESYQLRKASQNTINNKLATLKSLFGFGVKTGYLEVNPASLIKTLPAKDALNERLLVEAEVKRLIEAAKEGRDRSILKLLYLLGLRVSELVKLNWSDFHSIDGGAVVTVLGKGYQTRSLLIDEKFWSELQQLKRSDKTEAVFLSRFKNRLDRFAIHKMVKAAALRAGINPHTSAHWLRHAHATHSLKHGAGIELLMKSLGHSSLSVTSRYLHVQPNECTSKFIQLD